MSAFLFMRKDGEPFGLNMETVCWVKGDETYEEVEVQCAGGALLRLSQTDAKRVFEWFEFKSKEETKATKAPA